MKPKNVEDLYPLTPLQRLMLLHALTAPAGDVLVNRVQYEIRGDLRVDDFESAWQRLLTRHPALRTAVLWEGLEAPLQVVRRTVSLPFRRLDWSAVPPNERDRKLAEAVREDADALHDLSRAPLLRCTLIRLGPGLHRLHVAIHHLVVDRWSFDVLLGDLRALYEGRSLPPATPFRDYVAWLQAWDEDAARRFWRDHLEGYRPPGPGKVGAAGSLERIRTSLHLPAETTSRVERRASRARSTPASVILSAVALAEARASGRSDVVLGLTVAGRPPQLAGVEGAVGCFVNNVPARFRWEEPTPVNAFLWRVRDEQVRRQPHEHADLGSVRRWCGATGSPLFQTLVLVNLTEVGAEPWGELEITPVAASLDAAYPELLSVSHDESRLHLTLVRGGEPRAAEERLAAVARALDDLLEAGEETSVTELIGSPASASGTGGASVLEGGADAGLAPTQGSAATGPSESIDPSGPLSARVLELWRGVLGVDRLGLDDDFFVLGGTSLQAAEIFSSLEEMVGRPLPLSLWARASSVRALLTEIDEPTDPPGNLIALRSAGDRAPCVAVPGIGGNVVGLLRLARAMRPDRPFYGLQSQGLSGEAPVLESIEEIAAAHVSALDELAHRPVHLLGVCWGAAVAFEMARLLSEAKRPPLSIALLDPAVLVRAPETPGDGSARTGFVRDRLELYLDEFREGSWTERRRLVADKMRRAARAVREGGLSGETEQEIHFSEVQAANRGAIERYRPSAQNVRARVFITRDRPIGEIEDPRLEWLSLIRPAPDTTYVPGLDSGDAISQHAARAAEAFDGWLAEVEETG